jgi:hypothetical protein
MRLAGPAELTLIVEVFQKVEKLLTEAPKTTPSF